LSYGTAKRILYSILLSYYAIAIGSISLRQIWWLVKKSAKYDETLFAKMNALRNSMTKFGYSVFYAHAKATLIIDEGISHIPFILGLENPEINNFIELFHKHLAEKSIIFIEVPLKEILIKRITTRGHKRVRTVHDAEAFVDRNIKIAEYYKQALIDAGFNVMLV